MSEYNGSRVSFLSETTKKLINLTQKVNTIIGLVNNQDSFSFDFYDAVKAFKEGSFSDIDGFCCDETLSHFLLKKEPLLKTAEDKEIYFLALRNHLIQLQEKEAL